MFTRIYDFFTNRKTKVAAAGVISFATTYTAVAYALQPKDNAETDSSPHTHHLVALAIGTGVAIITAAGAYFITRKKDISFPDVSYSQIPGKVTLETLGLDIKPFDTHSNFEPLRLDFSTSSSEIQVDGAARRSFIEGAKQNQLDPKSTANLLAQSLYAKDGTPLAVVKEMNGTATTTDKKKKKRVVDLDGVPPLLKN